MKRKMAPVFLALLSIAWHAPPVRAEIPRDPVIPGDLDVDFAKQYDVTIAPDNSPTFIYKNCRILGFTSSKAKQMSKIHSLHQHFQGWVVLELPDKRLVYIKPWSAIALEESKP